MIEAWRYVFGRLVETPGGPVDYNHEQRVTSISAGLPAELQGLCDHRGLFPNQLIAALIHPASERSGALWFWPAICDGSRYMLASALRARPESGDGGLSRRHAQAVTWVFREADWRVHAPRLIANAPRWLRAEPETSADWRAHRDPLRATPPRLGPDLLPEQPRCASGPLARPGSLLWRLAGALEDADANLCVGAADGLRSQAMFLKALACVAALLPAELRIWLTAAAGFAAPLSGPEHPFALQYLPEAPPLTAAGPGLLEQIARGWLYQAPGLDLDGWQRLWHEGHGPAAADAPPPAQDRDLLRLLGSLAESRWDGGARRARAEGLGSVQSGALARRRYALICTRGAVRRSVSDLAGWLAGTLPEAPPRPPLTHPKIGAQWLALLTTRLNDCVTRRGEHCHGAGRALVALAGLIDSDPTGDDPAAEARSREQAAFWAAAWAQAAATRGRAVLRWSALLGSPRLDAEGPGGDFTPGWFLDFGELRALATAVARARLEPPPHTLPVAALLEAPAVRRRLRRLRQRAGTLLIHHPRSLVDLAAVYPALLAPRPDDDPAWLAAVSETVQALLMATRLYRWSGGQVPEGQQGLHAAATKVAARAFDLHADDSALRATLLAENEAWVQRLLRRYWAYALAPEADRDNRCSLWRDAVVGLLRLHSPEQPPAALGLLLRHCQSSYDAAALTAPGHLMRAEPAARELFQACLDGIAPVALDPIAPDPVTVAEGLLLAIDDPRLLAPGPEHGIVIAQLGQAVTRRLQDAIGQRRASLAALAERLLPRLAASIDRLGNDGGVAPEAAVVATLLDLARLLVERLLGAAAVLPRQPVCALLDQLEGLLRRAPDQDSTVAEAAERTAVTLARSILAGVDADPPRPWLDSPLALAEAPLRRCLARRLGFPRCVYFGGLTPADEQDPGVRALAGAGGARDERPTHQALGLVRGISLERHIRQVIGYGAATCWRSLFAHPDWRQRSLLGRLLREPGNRGATAEALAALTDLALTARPAFRALIDEHTWFTVGFFADLQAEVPPMDSALMAVPVSLEQVLRGDANDLGNAYAVQLGRLIAASGTPQARALAALFDQREAVHTLPRRILLLPGGWADFADLPDLLRRHGLLRLLYLLALVRTDTRLPAERRFIVETDLLRTLQLPARDDALLMDMDAFLSRQPDLRAALREALPLVGPRAWPGWPL